jgi:NAD(P)-dependent dehydrogenase (short-subunit alcohol dehydrogenase family)
MTTFDMAGKVAIVTGATKGIGRAVVEALAAHGARIVVSSRRQNDCDAVAAALNEAHGKGQTSAWGRAADINRIEDLESVVAFTAETCGRLDVLVANAAVMPYHGPSVDTPEAVFKQLLDTNIYGNFRFCHAAAAKMRRQGGGGSIVLVTSGAAALASPDILAYCVSKAGETHMAKGLALEFAPDNIRVNCVAPGFTRSETSRAAWESPDLLKATTDPIPLKRIGEAEEVAAAVLMLASPAGAFITGATIPVDGGATTIAGPMPSQAHLVEAFGQGLHGASAAVDAESAAT